ncbi:MAG: hypothetical protein PHT84_02495 [Candidatus Pacebacteria bacterium]|nr:hypothetical protein [Candidatus Paceibacterota bacterium]
MKKILILLIGLFFILIIGCDGPLAPLVPDEPDPVPILELAISASPLNLTEGEQSTVVWNTNGNNCTLNGEVVSSNGIKVVKPLNTTDYTLTSCLGEIKKTSTITIVVEPVLVPTRTDTLCRSYWQLKETIYLFEGEWHTVNLQEGQKRTKRYFYPNNTFEAFLDGALIGNGNWQWLSSDSILLSQERRAYKMTDTTLVLFGNSENAYGISTFVRSSK